MLASHDSSDIQIPSSIGGSDGAIDIEDMKASQANNKSESIDEVHCAHIGGNHLCFNICMHACTHARMKAWVDDNMCNVCVHACIYERCVPLYAYLFAFMHACVHACVYACKL